MTDEFWESKELDSGYEKWKKIEKEHCKNFPDIIAKMSTIKSWQTDQKNPIIHYGHVDERYGKGLVVPICFNNTSFVPENWYIHHKFGLSEAVANTIQREKTFGLLDVAWWEFTIGGEKRIHINGGEYFRFTRDDKINCVNCVGVIKRHMNEQKNNRVKNTRAFYIVNVGIDFPVIIRRTFNGGRVFMHQGDMNFGTVLNNRGEPNHIRFSMVSLLSKSSIKGLKSKTEQYYSLKEIREIFGIKFSHDFVRRIRSACSAQDIWINIRAFKRID